MRIEWCSDGMQEQGRREISEKITPFQRHRLARSPREKIRKRRQESNQFRLGGRKALSTLCTAAPNMGWSEMSMEQVRIDGVGEHGRSRENPPTRGIIWHDSHMRKSRRYCVLRKVAYRLYCRGSNKAYTATRIKRVIATNCKTVKRRAVFSSCCVCLWNSKSRSYHFIDGKYVAKFNAGETRTDIDDERRASMSIQTRLGWRSAASPYGWVLLTPLPPNSATGRVGKGITQALASTSCNECYVKKKKNWNISSFFAHQQASLASVSEQPWKWRVEIIVFAASPFRKQNFVTILGLHNGDKLALNVSRKLQFVGNLTREAGALLRATRDTSLPSLDAVRGLASRGRGRPSRAALAAADSRSNPPPSFQPSARPKIPRPSSRPRYQPACHAYAIRERAELTSAEEAMEFTCSEYWDMTMVMCASDGQASCMLYASNVRESVLLWA
ncbi:hypothetical protein PR048_001287 [Dryococelus australis]|uniref:Uncharacterized protein n=1 Tax=Dryococelus australis TaxID=614101 RepID=A0ABQ9IH07_9NEOP|nr:hypothetical protein PR048_001287 [Dryococelus australis]